VTESIAIKVIVSNMPSRFLCWQFWVL